MVLNFHLQKLTAELHLRSKGRYPIPYNVPSLIVPLSSNARLGTISRGVVQREIILSGVLRMDHGTLEISLVKVGKNLGLVTQRHCKFPYL